MSRRSEPKSHEWTVVLDLNFIEPVVEHQVNKMGNIFTNTFDKWVMKHVLMSDFINTNFRWWRKNFQSTSVSPSSTNVNQTWITYEIQISKGSCYLKPIILIYEDGTKKIGSITETIANFANGTTLPYRLWSKYRHDKPSLKWVTRIYDS